MITTSGPSTISFNHGPATYWLYLAYAPTTGRFRYLYVRPGEAPDRPPRRWFPIPDPVRDRPNESLKRDVVLLGAMQAELRDRARVQRQTKRAAV